MNKLIAIGARAPNFSLDGSDDHTHTLEDVLKESHVLLVFYPGNDTPG